ncbi:MAG: hypothetical protein ACO3EK_12435 [Alphaproteobacteria bacterium]|jgi:hypothetical protein
MQKTFIDGIGATQVVSGTIRLDLVTLSAGEGGAAPAVQPTGEQLVLSLEGFVRMHGQMTQVVEQLVERGILQRRPAGSGPGVDKARDGRASRSEKAG